MCVFGRHNHCPAIYWALGIDGFSLCDHCYIMFLIGISGLSGGFDPLILLVLALVVEGIIGEISFLRNWTGNPSNIMRRYMVWCDYKLNRESRSERDRAIRGGLAALFLILFSGGLGWVIASLSQTIPLVWVFESLVIVLLIDQRATSGIVKKSGRALRSNELGAAQKFSSSITYGGVEQTDAHNISRFGIETCANTISKGVVAPVFWYILFGLPGLLVSTSVVTMNEQVGNDAQKYRAFGFAAARLNHILMFLPACLAGLLLVIGSLFVPTASPKSALKILLRNLGKDRPFNSDWPISAMAGALNLALSGPQHNLIERNIVYWIGEGTVHATGRDISRGLYLYGVGCLLNVAWVAGLTVVRMI